MDKLTRELNALSKKGRGLKDEEQLEQISRLEFFGGMYLNEEMRPSIPERSIFAVVRGGARKYKEGKTVEAGLIVAKPFFPILYDGPQTWQELYDYENEHGERPFVDVRMVGIQRNKVVRTRPCFLTPWAIEIEVEAIVEVLDPTKMLMYLETAGLQLGIGDGRSMGYGRFQAHEI